ncbi:MAG: hypothetical protein AB1508_14390 [Pseudomonadota bacterium]
MAAAAAFALAANAPLPPRMVPSGMARVGAPDVSNARALTLVRSAAWKALGARDAAETKNMGEFLWTMGHVALHVLFKGHERASRPETIVDRQS